MRLGPFLLAVPFLLSGACDRKNESSSGSCPAAYPVAKGCSVAQQECPYDVEGKKMKCVCEPDTAGPSMWQCAAQ